MYFWTFFNLLTYLDLAEDPYYGKYDYLYMLSLVSISLPITVVK